MGRRRRKDGPRGILVVDKPRGPTSHDVVAMVRRALNTSAVGHAGTLDPMATGVLVIAVGEGTKLVRFLTSADKGYEAELTLGVSTHTLDAEGDVDGTADVPALSLEAVQKVAASMVGPMQQRAPKVSAIKVDGKALHARVRAGEDVVAPLRDVTLREIRVQSVDGTVVTFSLSSSKGFYVRSLGRDLAERLGTLGHLSALRRTRSGTFDLLGALPGDRLKDADAVRAALRPLEVSHGLPTVRLTAEGVVDARHGRRIEPGKVDAMPEDLGPRAFLDPDGALIAIGRREEDLLRVVRGIAPLPLAREPDEDAGEA